MSQYFCRLYSIWFTKVLFRHENVLVKRPLNIIAGYICQRGDLLANNCCGIINKRYICDTCNIDGCCVVYEHCVSCCLNPNKVDII